MVMTTTAVPAAVKAGLKRIMEFWTVARTVTSGFTECAVHIYFIC
jgi:hypothetical protein